MRRLFFFILIAGFFFSLIVAITGIHLFEKSGPLSQNITYVVPKGISLKHLAQRMENDGIVEHAFLFYIAGRLRNMAHKIKAGEYEILAQTSLKDLLFLLQSGRTYQRFLAVPEGLTVQQIISIIKETEGLNGEIIELPEEGSLLPETYAYSKGDNREDIILRMQRAHDDFITRLWSGRPEGFYLKNEKELVTMASIIERETGLAEERPIVAGVFYNRLQKGMPLQSDPTIIYPLSKQWGQLDRPLYRKDWLLDSPYNTYQNAGLPPGPIANPGKASLKAAFEPARHDYLYFVADGSGGHAFAKTLKDHNNNVAQWQKFKKDHQKQNTP